MGYELRLNTLAEGVDGGSYKLANLSQCGGHSDTLEPFDHFRSFGH